MEDRSGDPPRVPGGLPASSELHDRAVLLAGRIERLQDQERRSGPLLVVIPAAALALFFLGVEGPGRVLLRFALAAAVFFPLRWLGRTWRRGEGERLRMWGEAVPEAEPDQGGKRPVEPGSVRLLAGVGGPPPPSRTDARQRLEAPDMVSPMVALMVLLGPPSQALPVQIQVASFAVAAVAAGAALLARRLLRRRILDLEAEIRRLHLQAEVPRLQAPVPPSS